MTSPASPTHQRSVVDACDELEQQLLELTTAHLEEARLAPVVDEFDDDFL